jgi:hypothetical protein
LPESCFEPAGKGGWPPISTWINDQLQNDLECVEMERVTADNPIESRQGPSDPKLIQIDKITGLDDPEVTTPHTRSPGNIFSQTYITRTSVR